MNKTSHCYGLKTICPRASDFRCDYCNQPVCREHSVVAARPNGFHTRIDLEEFHKTGRDVCLACRLGDL